MLLTLQSRIAALIELDDYFDGVEFITEQLADIETAIETAIGKLSFCVVIATADGSNAEPESPALVLDETLTVTLIQNPLTDPQAGTRNTVDGLERAMLSVHDALVFDGGEPRDRFRVVSHQAARTDEGLAMQQFVVRVRTAANALL